MKSVQWLAFVLLTSTGLIKSMSVEKQAVEVPAFSKVTLRAAELGNVQAQCSIGLWFLDYGEQSEALMWLEKAAHQGHHEAQYNLAWLYASIHKQDEAFEWYKKAAQQGHSSAQYELARLYAHDACKEKSLAKSLEWYRRVVDGAPLSRPDLDAKQKKIMRNKRSEAACRLGQHAEEVSAYDAALEYYQKSLLLSVNYKAFYRLGMLYEKGKGVPQDSRKAQEFFVRAVCSYVCSRSDRSMRCYYCIIGNELCEQKKFKEAIKRYKKAIEASNDEEVAYAVGISYAKGQGFERDMNKAICYIIAAAEYDHKPALEYLSNVAYTHGLVAYYFGNRNQQLHPDDHETSCNWYKKAVMLWFGDALQDLKQLAEKSVVAKCTIGDLHLYGHGVGNGG